MEFSVGIPTCKEGLSYPLPFADLDDIVRISQVAERLGYHSVWANDHIMAPQYVRDEFEQPPRFYEPLITLTHVAAKTSRIRLATGVLVLPMREPAFLAKQVATLDHASGGRVILGVGVGAYREELERITPRWKGSDRGEILREGLQALRLLFTERQATFSGRFYEFDGIELWPKPLQDRLPIYVGGNHVNQLRRAVLYADGWMSAALPPSRVRECAQILWRAAEEVGRNPREVAVVPQVAVCIARTHEEAVRRFEQSRFNRHLHSLHDSTMRSEDLSRLVEANLVGAPEELIERVQSYEAAGASLMGHMSFVSPTVAAMLEDIEFFAEEVSPQFRKTAGGRAP